LRLLITLLLECGSTVGRFCGIVPFPCVNDEINATCDPAETNDRYALYKKTLSLVHDDACLTFRENLIDMTCA
jgi:hypothetical protein